MDGKSLVPLSGSGINAYDLLEEDIQNTVEQILVKELRQNIEIEAVPWCDDLMELGIILSTIEAWEDQSGFDQPTRKAD